MISTNSVWIPDLGQRSGPFYLPMADALEADIAGGRIKPGDRLPAQRDLATRLKIDFTTVGRAFAEARRRGLIEATVGRGSFVRRPVAAADAMSPVDMTMNLPPQPASLDLQGRIERGLAKVLARPDFNNLLTYREAAGAPGDRRAGAHWLAPRLADLPIQRLLIASLAPDLTYYIGGLAKVLTPMLRVAYLVAPDAAMASRLTTALRALTGMAPPLMVALATDWITSGQAAEILTALRQESIARQRLAADLLPADLVQTQPEAHHL